MRVGGGAPALRLTENPDILAALAEPGNSRPRGVVGFAAETEAVEKNAEAKRARKGCDWILANDVSPATGTFGGDDNEIIFVTAKGNERWPRMSKIDVASRLAARAADWFAGAEAAE